MVSIARLSFAFAALLALPAGTLAAQAPVPKRGLCDRFFTAIGFDANRHLTLEEMKSLKMKKGADYFHEFETVGTPDGPARKLKIDPKKAKEIEKDYDRLVRLRAKYEGYDEALVRKYLNKKYNRDTPPPEVIASFHLDGTPVDFRDIQDEIRHQAILEQTHPLSKVRNVFSGMSAKDMAFEIRRFTTTKTAKFLAYTAATTTAVVSGSTISTIINPLYTDLLKKKVTDPIANKADKVLTAQERAKAPLERADKLASNLGNVDFSALTPEMALDTWHKSEKDFVAFYEEIRNIRDDSAKTAPDPAQKQYLHSLYLEALQAAAREAQFLPPQLDSKSAANTVKPLVTRPTPVQMQEIATLAAWKLAIISEGKPKSGSTRDTPSEQLLERGIEAIAKRGHLGIFVDEFVSLQRESSTEIRKAIGP